MEGHVGEASGREISASEASGSEIWGRSLKRSLEEKSGVGIQKVVPLSAKMQKFLFFF